MRNTLVASVVLLAVVGCGSKHHGSGGNGGFSNSPSVTSTGPPNASLGVPTDGSVTATFSEPMDPATINNTTFTLTQGGAAVPGTVGYSGLTATFTPMSLLAPSTTYTATVTNGAKSVAGTSLGGNNTFTFTTAATGNASPTVSSTSPDAGATGVPTNSKIALRFSTPVDPATVNGTTITLQQGSTSVPGTVTYLGDTATFAATGGLGASLPYTITATTGVKDLSGNALATNFVSTFTTGASPDTTPPTVIATMPAASATGVPTNQKVNAVLSEALDPSTVNASTFTLLRGTTPVLGAVLSAGTSMTLTPTEALANSTVYTATITTGVKDLAGNALATAFTWTFTTGSGPDTTAPTVILTNPANLALNVPTNTRVNATFSEAMEPSTLSTVSFTLKGPGGATVLGTVSYDALNKIATFTPSSSIAANASFTATVTTRAKDLAGNALVSNFAWTFSTGASANQGPNGVQLGAATAFAVLAGSTVTNTGLSKVTGDVGLSPGSGVTGFPPGVVNGTIRVNDTAANKAKLDLTTGYNDAAGRTTAPISQAGNLGGLTLAPGLYKSTGPLEISSGDLTLDAKGDSSAVWIFQIATTFNTTAGRQVILAGGAKAANVYWQVGSSATLGTNSVFKGTIMADQSVSLLTGASLEGRALARIGAVTLDNSTVTLPTP